MKVLVTGEDESTKILSSECLAESAQHDDVITRRSVISDLETGAFQRVVDAGSFKCVNENACRREYMTVILRRKNTICFYFQQVDKNEIKSVTFTIFSKSSKHNDY